MSRFVDRNASDEIVLANGDRVTVRQKLTAPEQTELSRQLFPMRLDQRTNQVHIEPEDYRIQKLRLVKAYLVDWSFADDAGTPVPFAAARIDELDQDTIDEIAEGIDRLIAERAAVREKKDEMS